MSFELFGARACSYGLFRKICHESVLLIDIASIDNWINMDRYMSRTQVDARVWIVLPMASTEQSQIQVGSVEISVQVWIFFQ